MSEQPAVVAEQEIKVQQQDIVQQQKQPEEQYFAPTSQPHQYKIFINQCNSYLGSQLLQTFRNDDQIQVNPNLIISTLKQGIKYSCPNLNEICQAIKYQNKRLLNSVLHDSDIIVFHIDEDNISEFQYIVNFLTSYAKTLKQSSQAQSSQKPKIKRIICISSLVSWNGRRNNSQVQIKLDNLACRNSTNTYLMELQNICLHINNLNQNGIQSFVIASGIVYGAGEGCLFSQFKKALQQEESLKIYGTGKNYIPLIHIHDLCQMTKQLAFKGYLGQQKSTKSLPKSNYYFGVDSSLITQQQLFKCIAETLGNGAFDTVPIEQMWLNKDFDIFTLDCKIDESQRPCIQQWHSQKGIIENMGKIVSEFNLYRGLKPNKIVILGAPVVGKTKIAEFLKQSYGLPILNIKQVIQQLQQEDDDFAKDMKIKIEQLRNEKIEEERKAFEDAKKKKKGKKDAVQQFDPTKVVARLCDEDLIKIYKRRLNKSDCLNKGYILDGWPKSSKQCQGLFLNEESEVQTDIFPNSCFFVAGTEDQIKERIKNLPAEVKEGTHWNQQATARRFQAYNQCNQEGAAKAFFDGKVDIKDVPFIYEKSQQFINFIQRNGPLGFKKKVKAQQIEEVEKQNKEDEEKPKQAQQQKQKNDEEDEQEEEQQQEVEEQEADNQQFDLQKLTEHEKQILNQKSRPIRQYLIDNVIPQITQGLLEICKQTPRDPIQFLIKFLESKEALKAHKQS